ncbi:MAG: DEAD/DEAH box helicase [Proteobacteria bacterium]|nr:MAG: DEAD/DEAH box helicase [Pseudomonadota bacterium]
MTKAARSPDQIKKPSPNDLLEMRGGTWRFLREERGFWELELIKQGTQFVENPARVWALPHLEKGSLKLLDSKDALTPRPQSHQVSEGKFYRPVMHTKMNQSLQDSTGSNLPTTALNCAIQHKDWQFEPWRRIVDVLPFPRILIADDVGLGKTTEAAIILAELARRKRADRVLIITPQHLAEKWQDELYERFGLAFEIYDRETRSKLADRGVRNPWEVVEKVIVSRDFLKRWENLKPLENVDWDMIVIDEAHHFVREKSKGPSRLRELAEKIVYRSPGLIMLSATPFTGSIEEFHSLLRLLDDPEHSFLNDPWLQDEHNPCPLYIHPLLFPKRR